MQIHRVIQERRRALGMTQEQVADALGVTAPAVNKWERGASCPDLGLLSPLARLLRIDLNELMGFHAQPSDAEAQELSLEVARTAERDGLDAGFALARERLREYPSSGDLTCALAALLQARLILAQEEPRRDEYQAQLDRWYALAANCDDPRVRERVNALRAGRYISRGDWDAARRAIDAMPEHPDIDRRAAEANLRLRRGEPDEAAKLLQGAILSAAGELCAALLTLAQAELAAGEAEAAAHVARAAEAAARDLELWRCIGLAAPLMLAVETKDAPEALRRLREVLDALAEPWRPANSPLYRRVAGGKRGTLDGRICAPLLRDLETNPDYDFLRGEAAFSEIVEEFRRRALAAESEAS